MRIAKSVMALEPYVPGEQPVAKDVIKLNTNENPYPPSPHIAEVLQNFDIDKLRRYPAPNFDALRERIAAIYNTHVENIFIGNGSDEVLTLAARAFVNENEAIGSFDPSYSLYKTLAAIRNVPFVPSPLTANFEWQEPVTENVALFLLTCPNAPTSLTYDHTKIEAFATKFKGVVIVDEAYAEFAESNCMALATREGNTNLIVMRTLSKSFSLAGLRLGYCIGPRDLIEAMYKVKDSYNVDALAQAVALAAFNDLEWMRTNAAKVRTTRERFADKLRALGWNVPKSESNFLFAKPAHRSAAEIFDALRQRNIFVRYFPGPKTGERLRITIGTDDQMDKLLTALKELDK